MKKTIQILFLIIFVIGCGETKLEKKTRQDYSSIIRRTNANYQNLKDNKQQEESLSMMKSRDFYATYTKKFSEIRDDLAGAPQAEKFEPVKIKIDSILTLSNKYMNNRQSILMSAFDATNAFSDYTEDLSDVISYVDDYDQYSSRSILNSRVSRVVQDSIDFHKAYRELENDINQKDSLVLLLKNKAISLNKVATKLNFKDTLNFHKKVIGKKSVFTNAWNNLKGQNLTPNKDIATYLGN